MRVAILHYHLRPGGVTRVVELGVEALTGLGWDPLVVVGEPAAPGCRIEAGRIRVVPDLAYGGVDDAGLDEGVREACRDYWGADADVLHIHNHSLGKNLSLPAAVARWSAEGRPMALQMHDFAENGRPSNYRLLAGNGRLERTLYPEGGSQVLVVLSSFAANKLKFCGADPVILPNPVVLPGNPEPVKPEVFGADSLVVYPTRAIRRKNIGEFLLYSLAAREGEKYLLTSAPLAGADRAIYEHWRQFATEAGLPVVFDAAARAGRPVYDFLPSARVCVTTSVEEGFGMAFLEPWAAGSGVVGRDLPGVTDDFRRAGLDLGSLTAACPVPAAWIDRARFRQVIEQSVGHALEAYGLADRETAVRLAEEAVFFGNSADFGRLDEVEQQRVIRHMLAGNGVPPGLAEVDSGTVAHNASSIRKNYSLAAYGKQLASLYGRCLSRSGPACGFLDAGLVLKEFLNFADFFALRVGEQGLIHPG